MSTLELNVKAKRYIKSPHVDELKAAQADLEYQKMQLQATIKAIQAHKKMYVANSKPTFPSAWDKPDYWTTF